MFKSIVLSMMVVVGCSSSNQVVDNGSPVDVRNNNNVSCVVNGQAYSCNANSWTYETDLQMVSCNDVGVCKNGEQCVLWTGAKGICTAQ